MKDLKKTMVLQELTNEEAMNTYGGKTKAYVAMVVIDGKIALVAYKSK